MKPTKKVFIDFFRPNHLWGGRGEVLWVCLGDASFGRNVRAREREFAATIRTYCERLDGFDHPNGRWRYKGWTAVCSIQPTGQPLMMKVNDAIKYEDASYNEQNER